MNTKFYKNNVPFIMLFWLVSGRYNHSGLLRTIQARERVPRLNPTPEYFIRVLRGYENEHPVDVKYVFVFSSPLLPTRRTRPLFSPYTFELR